MKRIVLITGASAGIGEETAKFLAQAGFRVYGAARRIDKLTSLKRFGIIPLQVDVSDAESMVKGVQQILDAEGRIDVLINNAGFGLYGAIEDVAIQKARHQFEVNVFGAARLIQLVLPVMRQHESGTIINISSVAGKIAAPMSGWYSASKFAMEGLSDSLRNEVNTFGIRVVLIEPGGIKTEGIGLAANGLIEASGHTAYQTMVRQYAKINQTAEEKSPPPLVIAELIHKVLNTKDPKARYAAGYLARPALLMRRMLPDWLFDKLIRQQMK